ncbi:Sft1p PWA37_003027 [Arxiozyma heterogenica]|uniref:Sft1p n=1 Tax=Arxiozyma heterogenica TaxID=278026 RepID=UPI002EE4EEDA
MESNNDERLNNLANKLATFRGINEDINQQAINDDSLLNQLNDSFTIMASNIKDSASRLARTMNMGNSVWKMVGLALLIFFIIYTLFKLF